MLNEEGRKHIQETSFWKEEGEKEGKRRRKEGGKKKKKKEKKKKKKRKKKKKKEMGRRKILKEGKQKNTLFKNFFLFEDVIHYAAPISRLKYHEKLKNR
jgi:hypothetical protein